MAAAGALVKKHLQCNNLDIQLMFFYPVHDATCSFLQCSLTLFLMLSSSENYNNTKNMHTDAHTHTSRSEYSATYDERPFRQTNGLGHVLIIEPTTQCAYASKTPAAITMVMRKRTFLEGVPLAVVPPSKLHNNLYDRQ